MSSASTLERPAMQDRKRKILIFLVAVALCAFRPGSMSAQQSRENASNSDGGQRETASTELTLRNLSRVAASAIQIRSVLVSNPGLIVELKRWVAEDAATHGQVVQDADLTDDAIFDRLENDVKFRSTATVLLQRYGYLVPDVNPNSEEGKDGAIEFKSEQNGWHRHRKKRGSRHRKN